MGHLCIQCGLRKKDGSCYITEVDTEKNNCNNFIELQYDGKTPFTQEEHLYFLRNKKASQQMTSKRGML